MRLSIQPFEYEYSFSLLPALTVRACRCENPSCGKVHGYALELMWGQWGIALVIEFPTDDLT